MNVKNRIQEIKDMLSQSMDGDQLEDVYHSLNLLEDDLTEKVEKYPIEIEYKGRIYYLSNSNHQICFVDRFNENECVLFEKKEDTYRVIQLLLLHIFTLARQERQ